MLVMVAAGERADFVEIWRDEGCGGKEALAVERDGIGEQQRVAARGDHDGIHDERDFGLRILSAELIERVGDGVDDSGRVEHAGLDRTDGERTEEQADLLGDESRAGWHARR